MVERVKRLRIVVVKIELFGYVEGGYGCGLSLVANGLDC